MPKPAEVDRVVFVNYRHSDTGWAAQSLGARLVAAFGAQRVFLDVRTLDAGNEFGKEIEDHLGRAAVLLVLVGKRWLFVQDRFGRRRLDNEMDWVRREVRHGLEAPGCRVVPIFVDDAFLPDEADALPADIRGLLALQGVHIRQNEAEAATDRLVDLIREAGVPLANAGEPDDRRPGHSGRAASEAEVESYLRAVKSAYEHISLAGFGTRLRVPIQLEDMYVPLSASLDGRVAGATRVGSATEMEDDLQDAAEVDLMGAFRRAEEQGGRRGLVILGDPGSGKTTHLKRLLLQATRGGATELGLSEGTVPVFLGLSELHDLDLGLDGLLDSHLSGNPHLEVSRGFAQALLRRGNLLFLLDGLDEIPELDDRQRVVHWIERALEVHHDSRIVVTCRYAGYRALGEQFSGRFLELHLRPLNEDQATRIVHNWFRIVGAGLGRPESAATRRAQELVERLDAPDFRSAREFETTRNPLLLTAICLVYGDRGALPLRRADLYKECVTVLIESWHRKTELWLDAETAKRVLQAVAYWMHGKEGRNRATGPELEPVIASALKRIGREGLTAEAFLRAVRDDGGLFTFWSGGGYGFRHLGIQEYLTARVLHEEHSAGSDCLQVLAGRFGEAWWREVTLLLAGIGSRSMLGELMEQVVLSDGLLGNEPLIGECFDAAGEVALGPFYGLAATAPSSGDEALWRRQLAAVRILREWSPGILDGLSEQLGAHPLEEIAQIFQGESAPSPHTIKLVPELGSRTPPASTSPSQPGAGTSTGGIAGGIAEVRRVLNFEAPLAGKSPAPAGRPRTEPSPEKSPAAGKSPSPAPPIRWRPHTDELELVEIPAGEFLMGPTEAERSEWAGDRARHKDALVGSAPQTVRVDDFYLCKFPVTNGQYARFLQDNSDVKEPRFWASSQFNGPNQPVVGVTWRDALRYCHWAGLRLPTEAEWEYACKARTKERFGSGTSEDHLATIGWYYKNSGGRLHVVGQKRPNAFGLHDMHGNVWEWCGLAEPDGSGAEPDDAKVGPITGMPVRGGSYQRSAAHASAAYRKLWKPEHPLRDLGFRCAKTP